MLKRQFSRRLFLRATAAGIVGVAGSSLLAACGGDDDPTATTAPSSGDPTATTAPSAPGDPTATSAPSAPADPTATTETAGEEPTAEPEDEEPALGASLIGPIEGPTIITDPARWPTTFNEAPDLAARVAAGELPPVEERVSEAPIVVEPLHEIGKYGGSWRRGFTGPGDKWNGYRAAGMDTLIGWHYNGQEHIPNLAQAWETSADGTTFTFYLRPGHRWSDGEPFTADDFMYWYEDQFLNEELMPVKTVDMYINRQLGRMEKVDDHTIQWVFPEPYFLFLDMVAGARALGGQAVMGGSGNGSYAPAHYLKQFHPKYADPDELQKAIDEAGVDNWVSLYKLKADWALNPDLPVLTPWKTTSPINTPTWKLERNPYSIWVDTEGNQLPYIDDITMTLAENLEVINLRAIAGEYDFQARHIDLGKLPVILENRDRGDYDVYLDIGDYGADMAISVNITYEDDPEIGQWLANVDFRRALSLGIDRDQINEIFFLGTGTPGSALPSEDNLYSPGPEYRTLWSVYDPDKANEMLDALGLTEKDGEGFRQRLDGGGRLRLELLTNGGQFIQFTQIGEMIAHQWRDIGIDLTIREVERSLSDTMITANQHMMYAWNNDGSENLFQSPKGVIPRAAGDSFAPLYGRWYSSDGEDGKEPPEEIKEAMRKFDRAFSVPPEERIQIGKELWAFAADQVFYIGTVGLSAASMGVRIVKRNMGNIPRRQYSSPIVKNPCLSCPPTFYYKD